MAKIIRMIWILLSIFFMGGGVWANEEDPLPLAVKEYVRHFYSLYSNQDYKSIYKDLMTSRFKSSGDFESFKNSMSQIHEMLGPVKENAPRYLYTDEYLFNGQKIKFYRLEYLVTHDKGQATHRLVLMEEGGSLSVDGYAVLSGDKIYLAQGNIYGFEYKETTGSEDEVWFSEDFEKNWKDTKKEYLRELQGKSLSGAAQEDDANLPRMLAAREYFEDGTLKRSAIFKKERVEYKEFYPNGVLKKEKIYQDGKIIQRRQYNIDGAVIP